MNAPTSLSPSAAPSTLSRRAVAPAVVAPDVIKVAYVAQNAGFDLSVDYAIALEVKQTFRYLRANGCPPTFYDLRGRTVRRFGDIDRLDQSERVELGITGALPFKAAESGVRRLQRIFKSRYYALFDSMRFYDACRRFFLDYDVVYEQHTMLSLGAAWACKRLNKPYVVVYDADPLLELEIQGRPLKGAQLQLARWEARQVFNIADRIVCQSTVVMRRLQEVWGVPQAKLALNPLVADVELAGRPYDRLAIRAALNVGEAPVVAFVGSFQVWHGVVDLIDSFALVVQQHREARLLLIGDGVARAEVERRARERGVSDRVIITGFAPYPRMHELLSIADVAVAPYPHLSAEMWFSPMKLYEYMAASKAIVASRCGQITEVIQDGVTGVLVEPGDIHASAREVSLLLDDAAKRRTLGANAREQAVRRHSWTQYARNLRGVFLDAIAARTGKS